MLRTTTCSQIAFLYRNICMGLILICVSQFTSLAQTCKTSELDPRVKKFLSSLGPELSLEEMRAKPIAEHRKTGPPKFRSLPEDRVQRIRITADSIRVNVVKDSRVEKLPIIINYHGGGFILPLLPWMEYDALNMAQKFQAVVFDVDYRVAPENKFPIPVNDAFNAYKWVINNAHKFGGDSDRIILTGNSAGGFLVAKVSQLARQEGLSSHIILQVMNCPATDSPLSALNFPSHQENASGYMQSKAAGEFSFELLFESPPAELDPDIFPLHNPDLTGLPPALVITAEFDPLRDEGYAYAEKLRDAGVPVTYKCFPHQIHCLIGLPENAEERDELYVLMKTSIEEALETKSSLNNPNL